MLIRYIIKRIVIAIPVLLLPNSLHARSLRLD